MADHRTALAGSPDVSHLLETSAYVENLAISCAFYRRIFHFELIFQDDRMAAFKVPGSSVLLLFERNRSLRPSETSGGTIPPHGGAGCVHLCFAIPRASLSAWLEHLDAQFVSVESCVTQRFGGTSVYFRDPDGHSLEVATPGLWPNY